MAVIIGLLKVTAALMGVDSHTPKAACSNSTNIRLRIFFLSLSVSNRNTDVITNTFISGMSLSNRAEIE